MHGQSCRIRVSVSAARLGAIGMVMDFAELQRRLDAVIEPWRNRCLDEPPEFAVIHPTAENIAAQVALSLTLPAAVRLDSVELSETDTDAATYRP